MKQYAGVDVSLDSASVGIVDAQGKILKEAKVACEPQALIAWLAAHGTPMVRIGLEAGPSSQGLFAEMKAAGLPAELLETRHVGAAFKAMPVKTDRTDARGIAQLMRLGWFRSVHCKSLPARGPNRAVAACREAVQAEAGKLGARSSEAVSAGPEQRNRQGQTVGPVRVRITYERLGGYEVREATMRCVVDRSAKVVGTAT